MKEQIKKNVNKIEYKKLIDEAFNKAGTISDCFSMFYRYSTLNCFLAASQLKEVSPINTFKGWLKMGRIVKKGEKAVGLFMPAIKKEIIVNNKTGEEIKEEKSFFIMKNNWFGYSQTTALENRKEEEKKEEEKFLNEIKNNKINFDLSKLLNNLEITEERFSNVNGNVQGYAYNNKIAINPLAENPFKTSMHEVAHIVLEHTKDNIKTNTFNKHNIQEVEAETTAYLVCSILGKTEGLEKSRGYIQSYLFNLKEEDKEKSSKNIIKAVSSIIKNAK